jgi:tight adherence protein C
MTLLIALGLFVFLLAAITLYGYVHFVRPGRVYAQLGSRPADNLSILGDAGVPEGTQFFGVYNALQWVGEKIPVSAEDASYIRRRLMMAGYSTDSALRFYYGVKATFVIVFGLLAFLSRSMWTPPGPLAIIVPLTAVVAGWFLPNLLMDFLISRRQETLRLALPDGLDLLVVCVEAGLGLDQALRVVSRELRLAHPELCNELGLVSLEMRAGTSRATALNNLADRTGENEIRKLIAILVQTDRFGTSMADALRTHSDFMRVRRRQQAEERANKIGVKLVFPIFFFLLPSMIVVAAGPGVLQVVKNLFPIMRDASL